MGRAPLRGTTTFLRETGTLATSQEVNERHRPLSTLPLHRLGEKESGDSVERQRCHDRRDDLPPQRPVPCVREREHHAPPSVFGGTKVGATFVS